MIKRLLHFSLFVSLVFFISNLSAQNRQGGMIHYVGQVLDGETGSPMEYATVSVFAKKDSSLIGGGITDLTGKFDIETRPGPVFLEIEFISYTTRIIDNLEFERGKRVYDIGQVKLQIDGVALDEVEITAEKSTTQFALDKRIFNVGTDLNSRGGNAQDILDNVPSVAVDVEGNVTLRGSQNVRILIDGRPSGLVGIGDNDGLRNLPSELIQQIEVITNPSARYEAEGSAGIINIVLKKDKRSGFNGSVDFITGDPYKLGVGINTNYRQGLFNFFGSYAVRDNTSFGKARSYQVRYDSLQTNASFINRDFERSGINHTLRGGVGYSLTDKSVLTFTGVYRKGNDENENQTTYEDYFYPASETIDREELTGANLILRPDFETEDESNHEYTMNYDNQIGEGHTLKSSLTYRSQSEIEGSSFSEQIVNSNFTPIGDPYLFQRSRNTEGEKIWTFITDYVRPVGEEGVFEMGVRSNIRTIENDYIVEEKEEDVWTEVPGFANLFVYNEDVHAAYFQFGQQYDKWSYQMGLRGEYSHVVTELKNTNEINDRDYANLFPSVFLNYNFNESDGLQVSYSRRIRRPRFWYLNPFFTFSDPRNFRTGNPDLDPEFSDNYELGYIKYWEKASLTSSIYYRHTTGEIDRISYTEEGPSGETIRVTLPQNLSTEDNYGFEFVGSLRPTKWWRLDGNLNLFRSISKGQFNDTNLEADTYTWFSRGTMRFSFWQNADLQVRYRYRGGRETTQGRTDGVGATDLAFSKDFMNDNLTVTINARDIFNSRRRNSETYIYDDFDNLSFYSDGFFQWRVRDITINVNYRLNMKKKRSRGERGGDGEDFEGQQF